MPVFKSHNLHTEYILITAKGYPDYTTRELINQLIAHKPEARVYYLGDYDVYGFDIYMCYAMGYWGMKGILSNAHIVDVAVYWKEGLFDGQRLQQEMGKF